MPGKRWTGCNAGRQTLGIRSDGRVQPCLSLPESTVVGSLRENSLAELWNGDALAMWRAPVERHGVCADCAHGETCEGGCTGMALTYAGRRGENPMCFRVIEQKRPKKIDVRSDLC